jgi:hypothetical protein
MGVFVFTWPVWLLALLLVIDMILLFFVSMTAVFLLRVFFAERRRGRGRSVGHRRQPTKVVSSDDGRADEPKEDG